MKTVKFCSIFQFFKKLGNRFARTPRHYILNGQIVLAVHFHSQ